MVCKNNDHRYTNVTKTQNVLDCQECPDFHQKWQTVTAEEKNKNKIVLDFHLSGKSRQVGQNKIPSKSPARYRTRNSGAFLSSKLPVALEVSCSWQVPRQDGQRKKNRASAGRKMKTFTHPNFSYFLFWAYFIVNIFIIFFSISYVLDAAGVYELYCIRKP